MATAEQTLEISLKRLTTRLTAKEEKDFASSTYQDVINALRSIQTEQERRWKMMNMNRLQSCLEAFQQFAKVIEIFPNANIYIAFVWGPLKYILLTVNGWADIFDEILGAYEQLGEHMPLLHQYHALFKENAEMRKVLAWVYQDLLEFHQRAVRFLDKKLIRQLFRSMWNDFQTRFRRILDSLQRHKQLLAEQASLVHLRHYEEDRQQLLLSFEQQMADRQTEQLRKILEWIANPQSSVQDHESFSAKRLSFRGTGDWILKHEKISHWLGADIPTSSLLWMTGIPGAGKTILTSVIVEACRSRSTFELPRDCDLPGTAAVLTAYYYCKRDDPQRNEALSIYRGILHQILNSRRDLVPYFYEKYRSSGEANLVSVNMAQSLVTLLCTEILGAKSISNVFIIVDGVDECAPMQHKLFMPFFTELVKKCDGTAPGKVRVLFVSQEVPSIRSALEMANATIFELGSENNKDIEIYTDAQLIELKKRHSHLSEIEIQDIRIKTLRRSAGMFLFAELVLGNLISQPTRQLLLMEVDEYNFPKKLSEAYDSIIRRLRRAYGDDAHGTWDVICRLLGFMVCAKRPLQLLEIQAMLSIDLDGSTFDYRNRKLTYEVRELCGALVRVIGYRVELVHSTAIIHIRSSHHIRLLKTECEFATLCLQYLTFRCFERLVDRLELESDALSGHLALQDYAISQWTNHVQSVLSIGDRLMATSDAPHDQVCDFSEAVDGFSSFYEEDMKQEGIVDPAPKECLAFERSDCYDGLLMIWSHICNKNQKGFEFRNDVSPKALANALQRNRKLLEDLSTRRPDDFLLYYTPKAFKCSKITCYYFYEGFADAKTRDQHINKHTRPFLCPRPDCQIGFSGFANNRDLERHVKIFHPEVEDLQNRFSKAITPISHAKHECNLCGKRFTRKFHLRNHLRSHYGERPFACSECGKSFARSNDCTRHERLHSKR